MAVGFTPKHTEEIFLNDLSQENFLVLAHEAAKDMGWEIVYMSHNGLIAYTDNGIFSWNAEIKIKIENGVANIQSASTGSEMMDWGKNKKNIRNFINFFEGHKTTLSGEFLASKYLEIQEQFPPEKEDILLLPPETRGEKIKGLFSIFIPTQDFFITPILIDLNILLFILMALGGTNIILPDNESLLIWGANFRPLTLGGEWWRILTCCFLHIGIFHLLMNMYALLYIGILLEPHLGRTRFISAYLLTGITASMTSLWWHDLSISAGASGAIFGMYGVFLAMLTTNLIEKRARKALLASIAVFVGYNLLNGVKGGIDNSAHIGGLIGGLVIGYAFIPSLKKTDQNNLKYGTIGLLAIVIISSSFVLFGKIPNDIGTYDKKIQEFVALENTALEVYKLPQDTPDDQILYALNEKGIKIWQQGIKLIDSFNELNLPLEIRTKNRYLKEYCKLRIESYELISKAIIEKTDLYRPQIEEYNVQIEAKIKQLGGGESPEPL